MLEDYIDTSWLEYLAPFTNSADFLKIGAFVKKRRNSFNIKVYPEKSNVFRAFKITPYDKVRVVILGQDPYYTPGAANGLAFAHSENYYDIQPSLKNIIKELEHEYNVLLVNFDTTLEHWAKQGVLLLNTALTVEQNKPGSHCLIWKPFTEFVLKQFENKDVVFLLWGNHARNSVKGLNLKHVIETTHPSPLSAHKGFFGSNCFKECNKKLLELGYSKIKWF